MSDKNKTNLFRLLIEPLSQKDTISFNDRGHIFIWNRTKGNCVLQWEDIKETGLDSLVCENQTVLLPWRSYGALQI